MKIKLKKTRPTAIIPNQGTKDAAGFDLYTAEETILEDGVPTKVPTGLAMEIPSGHCGVVYSRSSSALKGIVITPLIVDADYRGEIFVLARFMGFGDKTRHVVAQGDRIAQMRIEKLIHPEFEEVEILSETERDTGGYGSTGA